MNIQRSRKCTCKVLGIKSIWMKSPLKETIYTDPLATEIERLCEENCFGCKIDHLVNANMTAL